MKITRISLGSKHVVNYVLETDYHKIKKCLPDFRIEEDKIDFVVSQNDIQLPHLFPDNSTLIISSDTKGSYSSSRSFKRITNQGAFTLDGIECFVSHWEDRLYEIYPDQDANPVDILIRTNRKTLTRLVDGYKVIISLELHWRGPWLQETRDRWVFQSDPQYFIEAEIDDHVDTFSSYNILKTIFSCSGMIPGLYPSVRVQLWTQIKASRNANLKRSSLSSPITAYMPIITGIYEESLFYVTRQPKKELRVVSIDTCYGCYNTSLVIHSKETMKLCKHCGLESNIAAPEYENKTASDVVSTYNRKQRYPRQVSSNVYKRCNHFKYWLKRIQGKERNKVTKELLQSVQNEIMNQNIDIRMVTYEELRHVLKRLGLQQFYINVFSIMRYITGEPLLELTSSQEKQLLDMFVKIQDSFQQNTIGRVNMLSYTFLLVKFCEILEWDEMALAIPTLKTKSKLHKQDMVWKEICLVLGWKYYPSVL